MAIEAIQLSMEVSAGSTASVVSELVRKPVRLLAIQVSWDGALATDSFSVFTTLESSGVTTPQAGDPPHLRAMDIAVRVPNAFSIAIPVPQRRRIEPPIRFAFVYNNTSTDTARRVSCTIWVDTEE